MKQSERRRPSSDAKKKASAMPHKYAPTHGEDTPRESGMDFSAYHTVTPRKKASESEPIEGEAERELSLPPNTRGRETEKKKKQGPFSFLSNLFPKGKKKPKKPKKPEEERRARLQKTLTLVIAGIAIAGLLCAAYFFFKLDRILVSGHETFTAQEIVNASGVKIGEELFLVDISAARKGIEELSPYLAVENIERVYPDTLRITVRERKEAAAIAYQNLTVVIDKEGYVLSIGVRADLTGLVLVKGMNVSSYAVNQRLGELTDFYTNTLIEVMEALSEQEILTEISELDISNPLSIVMKTTTGVTVHLGQSDRLEEKMHELAVMIPELSRLSLTDGTLDLSAKGNPVYSPEKTPEPTPTPEATEFPETETVTETPSGAEPTPTADPELDDLPSG